jgi:molybdate transport system permease protein
MDWSPLLLTLQLATVTTVALLLVGIPLAWWLSQTHLRIRPIVEALVGMPLVLPPSVIGFYLLVAFSPENALGSFLRDTLGLQLVFSFPGLVLASVLYSLPFMVHPLLAGMRGLPPELLEASYSLGKSRRTTLWRVVLPSIGSSLRAATVLSFAHTVGEFGVVLMIGGNIDGQTRVASIAVYDEVEALHYAAAHQYAFVLFAFSFVLLCLLYFWNQRPSRPF